MADITAIILTKNEEKNIGECISSVKSYVNRIVVIDSGSSDDTVKIAKQMGAEIFTHPFINYAKQYQFGVDAAKITTTWILRIDADERLTMESGTELSELCDQNNATDVTGIELRFKKNFLGRDLLHGGVYPWRKMNCYKSLYGKIESREMDEHILLDSGSVISMKSDSLHLDFTDLTFFIDKHNWYSTREAKDFLLSENEIANHRIDKKTWIKMHIYYKLPLGVRSWMYYVYRYYIRLGFLDGQPGKIYAFLQAYWYRFLVDAKIYEYHLNNK